MGRQIVHDRDVARLRRWLANDLTWLKTAEIDQEDLTEWLRCQFGQRVVERSMRKLNDRRGRAIQAAAQSYTPKGGLYVPSAPRLVGVGAAAAVSSPVLARPLTFMGGRKR